MGIFDALTTAVAGLSSQAFALNNVSGNIANSQTPAFKRVDTSFEDQIPSTAPTKQLAGSVTANSRTTNTVQGDIQTASKSTFMAINGQGFFVVQKPDNFVDNRPTFSGVNLYSRRGDFDLDPNGFLVNGAGYFLEGIPIDPTTGNLAGSVPQVLQFNNGFLPAQATTNIDYHLNLPRVPQTPLFNKNILGSDLLNGTDFTANPVVGAPVNATIAGTGASLSADAPAVITGTADLRPPFAATGGNLVLKFDVGGVITNVTVPIGAGHNSTTATSIQDDINNAINASALGAGAPVASVDGSGHLVLTGRDDITNITVVSGTGTTLSELGLTAGTVQNANNLITQGAVTAGQKLTVDIGSPPTTTTITFGFGAGQVSTLAQLDAKVKAIGGANAAASGVDANGNIKIITANAPDQIAIEGSPNTTITLANFGLNKTSAIPAGQQVVANDVGTFLKESISGGAITAFDVSGQAVNVQFRWAKVDSTELGPGHTDTWNLFYESDSTATGTQPAWTNAGVNYTFDSGGKQTSGISSITLGTAASPVTIDGVSLGTLQITHTTDGITQFSDPNGTVSPSEFQQNGFPAGQLKSIGVSDKGRITGTFSNGRTVDLAQITLANFSAAESLQRLDGGAFSQTSSSGSPTFNAPGTIVGSSLEASNTDIADEFTKLIVTQQAYSANTRVITTTNSMVQDLLNVVR